MALKSKTPATTGLSIKKRKDTKNLETILIIGADGTFKSNFAAKYCEYNKLNAIVLDFDRTNYSSLDIIDEFDLSNDRKAFKEINTVLDEISKLEYDTVIMDGITTVIESFIGSGQGLSAYSSRSKLFYKLIHTLQGMNKNLIFIGQEDADLDFYKKDESPSKVIIRLNAICNKKFKCSKVGVNKFQVDCIKDRSGKLDGKSFTY